MQIWVKLPQDLTIRVVKTKKKEIVFFFHPILYRCWHSNLIFKPSHFFLKKAWTKNPGDCAVPGVPEGGQRMWKKKKKTEYVGKDKSKKGGTIDSV